MKPLLEVHDLSVEYPGRGATAGQVAVRGLSLSIAAGEILGLAGQSGCGKSSLARALLGLVPASGGEVRWRGQVLDPADRRRDPGWRRELQMVMQDPAASFDPRLTISESLAEPLRALVPGMPAAGRRQRIREALAEVGIGPTSQDRFPHQFSGGQLQRIAIARALVLEPQLLVCDEVTSALDVSVQGQVVNLLADLRQRRGLAILFISHNLAVLAQLCDRIMVMEAGRAVECGAAASVLGAPQAEASRRLLEAVPVLRQVEG